MIAVIGTGSWGTTMALVASRAQQQVVLWGRDPAKTAALATDRRHPGLGETALPETLVITSELARLAGADLILWGVPTQHSRSIARQVAKAVPAGVGMVSLSKGIEAGTLAPISGIFAAEMGARPFAALSGPSHAIEICRGLPACLVAAGDATLCRRLVDIYHGQRLRIYTSTDVVGVEMCGALKNVIAVAAGMCEGLGLGDNARAALIARGLAEMRRLGRALGAEDGTFAGMAGIGDLMVTCYAPHGRNRALGLALADGQNPVDFLTKASTVAEGAWTSRAAVELGRRHGVELPIATQVAAVIWDGVPVAQAVHQLLSRAPKEDDA